MRSEALEREEEQAIDFASHKIHMPLKKNPKIIDENYKFENKNIFYLLGWSFLRLLIYIILPVIGRINCRYSIKGKKHLKAVKGKGVVIVSNHCLCMDATIIGGAVFRLRKVRMVSIKENIDIRFLGTVLKALGALPLADTYRGMMKFNEILYRLLERKKPVLFFPEASLWPKYTGIRPFHKGAFTYAVKADVPVLPIVVLLKKRKNGKIKAVFEIQEPVYAEGRSAQQFCGDMQRFYEDYTDSYYNDKTA